MKHYLFITKKEDIERYREQFERTKKNISDGKTPVYSEMRCAKTNLMESVPYNMIQATLMVTLTVILDKLGIVSGPVATGIVLVLNNVIGATSNYIFCFLKNRLRIKLCARMGIEPTEENFAVMESLEYQTV